jgi:hypothetical protein
MLMSPMGLGSEKDCAGDAQQKLKSTDTTSRQRGHPTSPCLHCQGKRVNHRWKNSVDVSVGKVFAVVYCGATSMLRSVCGYLPDYTVSRPKRLSN